jgi:xanthine dehydrogenase molybdenum-binding subunit
MGAIQCGFCTPGQILVAASLLDKDPEPSEEAIRKALKDTLCRCGAYPSILQAIQAASKYMRTGEPILSPSFETSKPSSVVGQVQTRPDALQKATGEARFADDFVFPDMLYGKVLRARVPHAILRRLEISRAEEMDGVVAVLTAEDVPGENAHGVMTHDWPVLVGVDEKVRYVGDAIALVAAETEEIASRALELIKTEFEELPVVTDPVDARAPDAPCVHEGGNLLDHIKVHKGDIEQGFSEADVIVEEIVETAINEHAYLEPECSIAQKTRDGRIEVYTGSQIPYEDRDQIAAALGVELDQVRVIGTLVGGGFGGREDIAGQIHAALLANTTGRPVKVLFDRHESLLVHPKRHATRIKVKIGAKQDGELTAVQTELYGDTGAYASLGRVVMTRATTHSTGPYVIPHVKADCYAMHTNNPPAGAFRGFGVTQSAYAIETTMDELAEVLDIHPLDLRRKNALCIGSVTNTGQLLTESVGLIECIDKLEQELGHTISKEQYFSSRSVDDKPHLRQAWGMAVALKNTGKGGGVVDKGSAEVELFTDGKIQVRTSSAELGQGLVTVLQLIGAECMSVPVEKVLVLLSDTDLTPDGGPTTASRQTYVAGNAVKYASGVLLQAMRSTLAERYDLHPEDIVFQNGNANVDGESISYAEIARMMRDEGKEPKARYKFIPPATQPLGTGGSMHYAYSFAAQAAEVEVDTKTGEVRVLRVIAVNDVGKVINPLGLQGQVEGGIIMGLGNALTEEYIVEDGIVFSDRLARYRIPSIVHTPEITSIVVEDPISEGPFGAKGVGELSAIPTTPAITNAIYNACGVRIKKLPVDQDWLTQQLLLKEAKK